MVTYNKGMIHQLKDFLFVFDMVHMLALDDIRLFHRFQGELLGFVFFEMGQFHVSESA